MTSHPRPPAQPNQSLIDGLECLEAIALADRPVGNRELARQLGLEPTRVNRLLGTLAYLGVAQRNADRKYAPGPGLHVLAAMGLRGSGLLKQALPVIRELQAKRPELSVALGVLWRRHVCYLYHGRGGRPVEEGIGGHALYPVEISSIGRALLAHLEPAGVRARFADAPPRGFTLGKLLAELRAVRRQGYARHEGHTSVAVAIGPTPVAAIAFSGEPTLPPDVAPLVVDLQAAAAALAGQMRPAAGA